MRGQILFYLFPFFCIDLLSGFTLQHSTIEENEALNNNTCTYPVNITCPPEQYCGWAQTVIIEQSTRYDCDLPLSINAPEILFKGGIFKGGINITCNNILIENTVVFGNLTINFSSNVVINSLLEVTSNIILLPYNLLNGETNKAWYVDRDDRYFMNESNGTNVEIIGAEITCKKLLIQSRYIYISNHTLIRTFPNLCLYKVLGVNQFMDLYKNGLEAVLQAILALPINIVLCADKTVTILSSRIVTTIIAITSNSTFVINSQVNTSASSCLTNLGQGKGLEAQMSNNWYCSSGGSSAGYGTLSNENCSSALQYFMFLAHSFPYLSKGPYLSTGSGGYGYRQRIQNQGAGGGIIFLYSDTQFYSYESKFLANGGQVSGDYYLSAGSGGTIFLYTQLLSGNFSNFSAAGGAAYNNNGSGAGGIVKISYNSMKYSSNKSMWVNVSQGYQPILPNIKVQANGIFYGPICPPGEFVQYLVCFPCPQNTYSILGDTSCQPCPLSYRYLQNKDTTLQGISNITLCFTEKDQTFVQIWIEPGYINWLNILIYIAVLVVTSVIGLLIKKKYRKKLTVMETQSFNLDDAKLDVQETRILTESLKAERNIKFQDLMYHIHRITLFGSNNPECPWALPQFPPEQIKQHILRQGFIDFSVKFNKVATWTGFQKFIFNLSFLLYPIHWYYYDKIKKKKYRKLLALVQESKEFNLINNYDFEDKNMVTIKISKNTDYTICYLDFMVYDRADTKYFNLSSPFIISISGQGNFLRPFYLEDRDVFFNTLFYIVNKAQEKNQKQEDEKKQLFTNLVSQKKKQENRNKLVDFLKKFNTISITLDLHAPLSSFIKTLISLIDYIAEWNETYFRQFSIQLDLILMISKVKKGFVVSNQIHILTNKNPSLFNEFMQENIPKMNRYQKYDLKLGLFVYNPDQQIKKIKNRKSTTTNKFKRSWITTEIGQSPEQEDMEEPFVEQVEEQDDKKDKKKKIKVFQDCIRVLNFIRYLLMTHRKLEFDKDLTKFAIITVILFQCMLAFIWSLKIQLPYLLANLVSPFIGILWMVSGSYGIGKLFLIFNAMALLDEIVTFIGYLSYYLKINERQVLILQFVACEIITIILRIIAIPLTSKFLSVTRKLSTSKMFK